MQDSQIPAKFSIPWGNSAGGTYINTIPTASQIGVNAGYASLTDGFVPLNSTPVASGGVPPRIQDMNGILNETTAWLRWLQAGGPVTYDATFQAAVGGYPLGAEVQSAATPGLFWRSTVDNNTTNPDTGGAGWASAVPFTASASRTATYSMLASDNNTYQACSGTFTITLPVVASSTSYLAVIGNTGAGVVNVNTNGATVALPSGNVTTSFNLNAGDFVGLFSVAGIWRVLAGSLPILSAIPLFDVSRENITGNTTITLAAYRTIVTCTNPSSITTTLAAGAFAGQEVEIAASNEGTVTITSTVSSGSPYFTGPDGSIVYSVTLPGLGGAKFSAVWDGVDWRYSTTGQTIVAPAVASNQAVQLGQFTKGGSTSIVYPGVSSAGGTVGSSGWSKDPSGLIRQWAYIQLVDSTNESWTFPIAFTSPPLKLRGQNFAVAAGQTASNAIAGIVDIPGTPSSTAASFVIHNTTATGTLVVCLVEAEGY